MVCGHIHKASLSKLDGLDYVNTGDWVESCTAAVEHADVIGEREVAHLVTTSFDGERSRWSGGRHRVNANAKFDARGSDP